MVALGNNVISYSTKSELSPLDDLLAHFLKKRILKRYAVKQQESMLRELRKSDIVIDIVFVLSGQLLLPDTLRQLKKLYPNAKFVWYMWDNIIHVEEYETNSNYFDRIISFDKIDAQKYALVFLPLFYMSETRADEKIYDIHFVGNAHSNRKKPISTILRENSFENVFVYFLTGKYTKIKYTILKQKDPITSCLHVQPLNYTEMVTTMAQSKCVIDIPATNQTGLTMRTIETIGAHTKLITSNENVKQYDFYNPENIYVLDLNTLEMPDKQFYDRPYVELEEKIKSKYSLESWVNTLIEHFDELQGEKTA
jgi:hypothetical protein